jgi:hypothetical protein
VREELAVSYAPRSKGPLGTALRSLGRFARTVPNWELFMMPTVRGELGVEAHNEWTLLMWAKSLSQEVSKKTKRHLKWKSIEQRISLAKGFLSHRYGFQIAGEAPRLRRFFAKQRVNDPFSKLRKKRRGMRKRHLRKLWEANAGIRAPTKAARSAWAAQTAAWHVLARGGEIETAQKLDLQFKQQQRGGRRYAILWIAPLKKRGPQPKLPQFIYEQPTPEEWEPYRALRRLADSIRDEPGSAPLFTAPSGAKMTTARFRAQNKRFATLLGWSPKEAGAHTPRIGGAIDYAGTGHASQLMLEAKGRWSGDIARIYARMTRRAHMAASDLMFEGAGRDLEELMPEFVEPGV